MVSELHDELGRLLGGLCDGTLTADAYQRLDELVQSDQEARRFYNNYMFMHAALYSQHAAVETAIPRNGQSLDSSSLLGNPHAPAESVARPAWRRWLLTAAALIGVAAVSSWGTYLVIGTAERPVASLAAAGADGSQPVAKITASRNCLWQLPTQGIGFGSELRADQRLELAAGLVEITFADGATVVLEGPATFDVRARGRAQLHSGRLAAMVPDEARGFEVGTSRLNVADFGTEFGLMTESEGTTEIHVFNGLVNAQLLDERGQQIRTVEINTAQAARIQPVTAVISPIPARGEEFVRALSVTSGPHDGLYAYDGFDYPAGTLSEQNGGFGWAGPWFNAETDAQVDLNSNGVKQGSLEYEGLVPAANRAAQTAQQNRIRRSLSTSIGGVFDAAGLVENQDGMRLVGRDGSTVYLSFLQRVNKTNDVFYGLELHRSDGNANRVLCIGHGAEGTAYGVTSNYNVYGPRNFPSLGEEDTNTNFFVVRITFGSGNRDRVEVFRNPESLVDEDVCVPDAELTGNFAFDRISLGNFHGTKVHEVDEIRVGTTFRAVTGRRSRGPDRLVPSVARSILDLDVANEAAHREFAAMRPSNQRSIAN
jgi:ferric-dicitrate binding protein FerR (iron transport regulator)